jgi:hypothetical protein
LRNIVFQVVSLLRPVDHRVYPLLRQKRVGVVGSARAFVEVVEKFVDRLAVVMIHVSEFLIYWRCTMVEARPLPNMGIFSKKFRGCSCYSSSLMSS